MIQQSETYKKAFTLPTGACDAHLHILDKKFARMGVTIHAGETVEEYKKIAEQMGTTRAVFVLAKEFKLDNTGLLAAIKEFGSDNARGIAVVNTDVTDEELARLHDGGVRGVRFSLWNPDNAVVSRDMIEPLAYRIANWGWNIQIHMSGQQIIENKAMLKRLPCTVVIDHMGRLTPEKGINQPAFKAICELVDGGSVWVKLSGAYLNTRLGRPYDDATTIARGFVSYAPQRLVWGSDWPHVTERSHKPSDIELLSLFGKWVESGSMRHQILVKNPETLYGFASKDNWFEKK